MRELLTRRLGPLPVWVWFVVFVLGAVIFLRFRNGKKPTSTKSSLPVSPNLTTSPGALIPYASDVFVNIQQTWPPVPYPAITGSRHAPLPIYRPVPGDRTRPLPSPTPIIVGGIGTDGRRRIPGVPTAPTNGYIPFAGSNVGGPAVPARQASVTYPVPAAMIAGANSRSTDEAIARMYGYSSVGGTRWLFSGDKLVIPS